MPILTRWVKNGSVRARAARPFYPQERKPNPCQRTLAGSGKVMLGKRSNSMGGRMTPTVRRDRCAPAQ